MLVVLQESMGEVTPVKLVVRTELCGIGAFICILLYFVFACCEFCDISVTRLLWGVRELFVGDIRNASLCISAIGFNMKGSCKHFLNHFRKPQRQFFES